MEKPPLPDNERKPNPVDELLEQIGIIQATCPHDYRLLKPHGLKPSKVDGYWLGSTEDYADPILLSLKCTLCNDIISKPPSEICPFCHSTEMEEIGIEETSRHFRRFRANRASIHQCRKCKARIVMTASAV